MKKVGRKQTLSPELAAELRAKYQIYLQVKREFNPKALADEYNLSINSVLAYGNESHKRAARVPAAAVPATSPLPSTPRQKN